MSNHFKWEEQSGGLLLSVQRFNRENPQHQANIIPAMQGTFAAISQKHGAEFAEQGMRNNLLALLTDRTTADIYFAKWNDAAQEVCMGVAYGWKTYGITPGGVLVDAEYTEDIALLRGASRQIIRAKPMGKEFPDDSLAKCLESIHLNQMRERGVVYRFGEVNSDNTTMRLQLEANGATVFKNTDSAILEFKRLPNTLLNMLPMGAKAIPIFKNGALDEYNFLVTCAEDGSFFNSIVRLGQATALGDLFRRAHNALLNEITCEIPIETVKSIDELVCKLDKVAINDPASLAKRIKERLRNNIGEQITCSIGFAANRLLAKVACKIDKPNGVTIWHPKNMPDPLFVLPLEDIPGVGRRMERRLNAANIHTIQDLYNAQPKHMRMLWSSVNGERMWYALHGYDIFAQPTSRGMFGHGRVLPPSWRNIKNTSECSKLLLTKAARRMRRDGFYAGKLWLWLDMRNGGWFGQRELPIVQDEYACQHALDSLWEKAKREIRPNSEIIRVGVTLLDLSSANERQLDMFLNDDDERKKCEVITNMIDRLNTKFGKRVLTLGTWTPPPGGYAGGKIAYNRIPSAEDFW